MTEQKEIRKTSSTATATATATTTTSTEPSSRSPPPKRVAIVGAGFAGLALANFLLSNQQKGDSKGERWTYQLFESKPEYVPIIGRIRLPNVETVLGKMKLLDTDELTLNVQSNGAMVAREDLMKLLHKNVQIEYNSRIVHVEVAIRRRVSFKVLDDARHVQEKESINRYFLRSLQNREYGPFDVVVSADGLFANEYVANAVIGDARWWYRWWDFGQLRLERGGDMALCDGVELGEMLITGKKEFGKFEAPSKAVRKKYTTTLRMIFLPIVVVVAYRIVSGMEQI